MHIQQLEARCRRLEDQRRREDMERGQLRRRRSPGSEAGSRERSRHSSRDRRRREGRRTRSRSRGYEYRRRHARYSRSHSRDRRRESPRRDHRRERDSRSLSRGRRTAPDARPRDASPCGDGAGGACDDGQTPATDGSPSRRRGPATESVARIESRRRGAGSESVARIEARRRENPSCDPPRRDEPPHREDLSCEPPRREDPSCEPPRRDETPHRAEDFRGELARMDAAELSLAQNGNRYFRHGQEFTPLSVLRRAAVEQGQWATAPPMLPYQQYAQLTAAVRSLGRSKMQARTVEAGECEAGGGDDDGGSEEAGEDANTTATDRRTAAAFVTSRTILSAPRTGSVYQPADILTIVELVLRFRARNDHFQKPMRIESIGFLTTRDNEIVVIIHNETKDSRSERVWHETFSVLPFVTETIFNPYAEFPIVRHLATRFCMIPKTLERNTKLVHAPPRPALATRLTPALATAAGGLDRGRAVEGGRRHTRGRRGEVDALEERQLSHLRRRGEGRRPTGLRHQGRQEGRPPGHPQAGHDTGRPGSPRPGDAEKQAPALGLLDAGGQAGQGAKPAQHARPGRDPASRLDPSSERAPCSRRPGESP